MRFWATSVITVLIATLLLSTILSLNSAVVADNAENLSFQISGTNNVFSTGSFDLCSDAHIGSCPISIVAQEQFSQGVSDSITQNAGLPLSSSNSVQFASTISPNPPTTNLIFTLNYGSKSSSLNVPISSFPSIGTATVATVPIPIGAALAALTGFAPLSAITMPFQFQTSNTVAQKIDPTGFSNAQQLTFSTQETQTEALAFTGTSSTSSIATSLESIQTWSIALSAAIPFFGSFQLYSTNVGGQTFQSQSLTPFIWYQVTAASQYSTVSGLGWYLAGSSSTLSLASGIVDISSGVRQLFTGWQGTITGNNQQISFAVNGVATENVAWQTQYSFTIQQSNGGTITASNTNQWVNAGSRISLSANPDSSHAFKDWLVNGQDVSNASTYAVTINEPTTVSAEYAAAPLSTLLADNAILIVGAIAAIVIVIIVALLISRGRSRTHVQS